MDAHPHGRAVQVDPMNPKLKAPGSKPLILKYDGPLSNRAFNFSLRRYNMVYSALLDPIQLAASASSSIPCEWRLVRRCRLTLSKPTLNAPGSMLLKLKYDGPLSKFAFKSNLRRYSLLAKDGIYVANAPRATDKVKTLKPLNPKPWNPKTQRRYLRRQRATRHRQGAQLHKPHFTLIFTLLFIINF